MEMTNNHKPNFTEAQHRLMSLLGKDLVSMDDDYFERRKKLQKRAANPAVSRKSLSSGSGLKPMRRFS